MNTNDCADLVINKCRRPLGAWLVLPFLFFPVFCFSQVDTGALRRQQMQQMEQVKKAQQEAIQKMKEMGINIDPNKRMTKEDANKLKQQLLGKANEMKSKISVKKDSLQNKNIAIKIPSVTEVVQMANRYFQRSYKQLKAIDKSQFDLDLKEAEKNKFSLAAARKLTTKGSELITFGYDHYIACAYLTAAVKALPSDTLSINNFGAYLRIIDSVKASLPVLLYANQLFSQSPVTLTQIGCTLVELGDEAKGEKYLKEALKYDAGFGEAHTALCEIYIRQNRLSDAIKELFAGVKGMGASYQQASTCNFQIQQQYQSSGRDDVDSKEEFWNEAKKQLEPSEALASLVPQVDRIKMPSFPYCAKVEDWTLGGGQMSAMEAYQKFHKYATSFVQEFQSMHKELPQIPQNAVLRDYPNERFALDCITEMFLAFSNKESKKYQKLIDAIVQKPNNAKLKYIENFNKYREEYFKCLEPCDIQYEACRKDCDKYKKDFEAYEKCTKHCSEVRDVCTKECYRQYCEKQCPNANQYNSTLRIAYGEYGNAFNQMVKEQSKILDDLFAFSDSWFSKIYSPYWSKIYAYEIRRVAIAIIENTFSHYPQFFDAPVNDACGSDCSVFSTPFRVPPEEDANNPHGNHCPENTKRRIPLLICQLNLDCESIEFGCTEGVSASVKRNFKHGTTIFFLGAGLEGGFAGVKGEAKFGGQFTAGDDGSVDVGFKGSISTESPVGKDGIKGKEMEFNLTIMKGLETETSKIASPFSK